MSSSAVRAANEITGITGSWKDPQYDAAGNMIFGPKSGSETTGLHYIYDAWNLLVAVYEDDGDGAYEPTSGDTLIATYEYDGQKRRVEKTFADGSSTDFYYNHEWQLLEEREFDAESDPIESHVYVWSARYIDAPILRDTHNDEGELQTTARLYYAGDANNNVTALLDSTGTVIERYVYTAYGSVTVFSSTWSNPGPLSPASNPLLYCGYYFDAETGNYLARNRFYNTALATWISRDPVGYLAGDFNLYRYCGNTPLVFTDPVGKKPPVGLVPRGQDDTPVEDWAKQNGYWEGNLFGGAVTPPLAFGCAGLALIRVTGGDIGRPTTVHQQPGTICCLNLVGARKVLAKAQKADKSPLLLAVQVTQQVKPTPGPGECGCNADIDPKNIDFAHSGTGRNIASWLGLSQEEAFWEFMDHGGQDSTIKHRDQWPWVTPWTYFCVIPNARNPSPAVTDPGKP